MKQKEYRKRQGKRRKFIMPASALLVLLSGCVVPTEDAPSTNEPTPEEEETTQENNTSHEADLQAIASSSTTSTDIGSQLQIDIYALEEIGDKFLRLHLGITNTSTDSYHLYDGLATASDAYTGAGIALIDPQARNRHLSYRQSDNSCFCSRLEGPIGAGETEEMWVIFPPPKEQVDSMTVTTPITPPLMDIPITTSQESIDNSDLLEPQILPLTMISENTEDNTGRTEVGDEVSILLSSDVLFETNSANLNNEAQGILEQVATEIDDASSDIVKIDGYADNTGSDSINMPLSQERAEAVESALRELITRDGVGFDVKGHGSSNPIATNSTEEGRERNRRVSVTFEK